MTPLSCGLAAVGSGAAGRGAGSSCGCSSVLLKPERITLIIMLDLNDLKLCKFGSLVCC